MDEKIKTRVGSVNRTPENVKSRRVPIHFDGKDEARRNFSQEKRDETTRRLVEQAKLEKKKDEEDRQKISRLLDRCLEILIIAMNSGGDVFGLLDPLISDNQCHMHSVLILDVLMKCYDNRDYTFRSIGNLGEKDRKILSYAVLFSLLKGQCKDKLGFTVHEFSIHDFNMCLFDSKRREKQFISEVRIEFNSYSVEHIKSVACKSIEEIFVECEATTQSKLKLLPCYPSICAVLEYIRGHQLPIIISLVSINTRVVGEGTKYNISSKEVRFYEFREDRGNRFYYKTNVGDAEKYRPTVLFHCYRLITNETPAIPTDYDITDLLMMCSASHGQLPGNAKFPAGYGTGEEYVRKLFEKHPDVFNDFNHYYDLGNKYNLINARYSRCSSSSQEKGEKLLTIERRDEGIFFRVDHICVSNYLRAYQSCEKDIDCNIEVDRSEVYNVNVKALSLEASTWFDVLKTT